MAVWGTNRAQNHIIRVGERSTWGSRVPTGGGSVLQWGIVSIVGIVLGIYMLGISSLPSKWLPICVLAVLFPFIAMIVGNVRKLLLAMIILDIPFQLDIHLFYRPEVGKLGAIGGLGISVTTVCLVGLYTLWLGELVITSELRPHPLLRTSLPLISYLAFVILSVTVAHDVSLSLFEITLLLQMFLFYLYIVGTVRTRQDVVFIVTILLVGIILQSLIMIGVYITGQDLSISGVSTHVDSSYTTGQHFRPGGTLGSPITAAGYFGLVLAPAIGVLLTDLEPRYKWLAVMSFSLGMVALVLTLSRAGWVAFLLSGGILWLLAWRRGWLPLKVPFTIAIVAVLLSFLFHDAISTRLFGYDMGSAYSRIPLMKLAFRMIVENPVTGIGANNFAVMIEQYARLGLVGEWLYVVHNRYLLIWAETGIGGLIAFMWFLLATIRRGWQCWQLSDPLLSPLALGFTAAIVGHMLHLTVELFNGRLPLQLLWLTAGLITAMRYMDGNSYQGS